ncbi:MAG: metallophosphatase domain-containing protein [Deltaproteobacteria bacterium]|nr:metallophosphatase domain-containing protein [Deltaproteobacteria bacterium]
MRIVAVADTHLREHELEVPPGDVFVHAGDLCRAGTLDELSIAAEWIGGLPHRHKIVVAGNHDWCFAREPVQARRRLGPDIIYLQDGGTTIEGMTVWGSPWQPWFFDWAFNLPRGEALAERWDLIPSGIDLLVTHGPPRGYGDRVSRGREGCDDLLRALDRVRPALHLFGHIHEDGGRWQHESTTVLNVTTAEGVRAPTVVDFDPATRVVTSCVVPPPAFT